MISVKTFKYVKDNGDASHRKIITLAEPNKLVRGYDISEESAENIEEIVRVLRKIEEYRISKLNTLPLLKFRSFKPENMHDIERS